jgi:signal transduction histidine kinase
MSAAGVASRIQQSGPEAIRRWIGVRVVAITCVLTITALTTEAAHWRPVTLVLALFVALVLADVASVAARRIRISAGLMVQTTIMALLGAGPAVAAGMVSTLVESRINRVRALPGLNNLAAFAVLGLVGGVLFDVVRAALGLERADTTYAMLMLPGYVVLSALNLFLVVAGHPDLDPGSRPRVLRETVVPLLPLELINAVLTVVAVLVWARAGLVAAATLLLVLAVTIPLARTLADALKSGDDLRALRQVSDERAAEVARLASDRDRLLTEVLQAEQRERGRLAASLHDGPMQLLMAMRQDAAAADAGYRRALDVAIAETRAIISAFHPATVRELGFEASLRAAVAPFPAARSVVLTVRASIDDRARAESLLLPLAQELVVNAVKHADPTRIDVRVDHDDGDLVLEISDDGVGIDTAQAGRAVQEGHIGLAMVRRRVEDAGGRLDIATRSDGGTRSRVTLPAP